MVDANAAHDIKNQTECGLPVIKWLLAPNIRSGLVVGGKLTDELRAAGLKSTLVELSRAGRLHAINDEEISKIEVKIRASCRSNDSHVVALAKVSRCSTVFTKDMPLHQDLKNRSLLPNGVSIYQTPEHSHLLTECRCGAN